MQADTLLANSEQRADWQTLSEASPTAALCTINDAVAGAHAHTADPSAERSLRMPGNPG